jgi:hypothetical protein
VDIAHPHVVVGLDGRAAPRKLGLLAGVFAEPRDQRVACPGTKESSSLRISRLAAGELGLDGAEGLGEPDALDAACSSSWRRRRIA